MNLPETNAWLRVNSQHVMRLAGENDWLAKRLVRAYWDAYHDQDNPQKVEEYLKVAHDYVTRDLTITERRDLEVKFDYKVGLPDHGPRIVVPDGIFSKAN